LIFYFNDNWRSVTGQNKFAIKWHFLTQLDNTCLFYLENFQVRLTTMYLLQFVKLCSHLVISIFELAYILQSNCVSICRK
jgi:hypothetical protein